MVTVCSWKTKSMLLGYGRTGNRMHSEHDTYYDLSTHALGPVCSWNTNVIMVWAWLLADPPWNMNAIMVWACMLSDLYAVRARTSLWFGHGCSGSRMQWNLGLWEAMPDWPDQNVLKSSALHVVGGLDPKHQTLKPQTTTTRSSWRGKGL